eukprot:TRINITY_DN21812_c0_g1_i1.p1 TRINITY_DN21812_c0_g1~~TRINITY_DN21812_c0_g1_i1.p1  ORF type:complete len:280 (-),score=51.23 TRINITY_DN21812_c0_g1_i1:15-854(-)
MLPCPRKDMTQARTRNSWPRLRTKLASPPSPSPPSHSPALSLPFPTWTLLLSHGSTVKSAPHPPQLKTILLILCMFTCFSPVHTIFRHHINNRAQVEQSQTSQKTHVTSFPVKGARHVGMSDTRSDNDLSFDMAMADPSSLTLMEEGRLIPADRRNRSIRRRRQAESSSSTTTTLSPASTSTTTACICPSTTTITSTTPGGGLPSSSTTLGITSTDGQCICPGQQTETTIEVETSTALPINSNEGRRLRRELLELEVNQFKTKFESKLLKNIPFLNTYV